MRRRAVIWLTAACATPSAPVQNVVAAAERVPPDLRKLVAILEPHARAHFTDATRACPSDITVGTYVDRLVQYGTRGPGPHALTGGCGTFPPHPLPIDPARDDAYWFCVIDSRVADREDPWHYELHVRVRKADGRVDLATASCPGQ